MKHAHVMKYEVQKNESHKVEDIYECKLGSKFYMGPRRFPREAQILDRFELPPILQDALLIGTQRPPRGVFGGFTRALIFSLFFFTKN